MTIIRSTGAASAAQDLVDPPDFDPAYGHAASDLERCGPPDENQEPPEFDAFWTELADRARAVDPEPRVTGWRRWRYPGGLQQGDYEVADLEFTSIDDVRIGGWVVRPVDGADQIAVCGHGYAGRSAPSCDDAASSALCVYPVARGLPDRSPVAGIGRERGQTHHAIWGIESPRTYAVIASAADYLVAATAALMLLPDPRRMIYHGGSFGGGVGAMTLSMDDRFDAAVLGMPTFGNQPLRVTQECLGSGRIVRNHVREHPAALETLRYADAASAARRVRVPVFATPALADAIVPPPGQFSVVNALAGPVWRHALAGGHGRWRDFDGAGRSADPADWAPGSDVDGRPRQPALPTRERIDEFLRSPSASAIGA